MQEMQKLPLKAVLLVEAKNIQATGAYGIGVDISLKPGLNRAIQSELATVFEEATLAETAENAHEGDIIVHAALRHKVFVDHWNGAATADWELQLDFKDPPRRMPISTVLFKNQTVVSPSGESTLASVITGACFFVCSPLTFPWMARAAGIHAMEVIEGELTEELHKLPEAIRNDHKIFAYARGDRTGTPLAALPIPPSNMSIVSSDVDVPPLNLSIVRRNAFAIVIGIEKYRNNLPAADFAVRDAKIVAKYLTKTMGYQEENVMVLLDQNASRADLEKYIETWLRNRADKDSSVFFYYSGHGAPNPKNNETYLVPYDGDPAFLENTGYSLKRLYRTLSELPVKESIVLLDSCFSGAGGRSVIAKGMRPMMLSVENPALASGRTVVLSASAGDQVASTYLEKGHGLLTYFVLKGLRGDADRDKNGVIDLPELFDYLKPEVERIAKREFNNVQTPQLLGAPEVLEQGMRLVEKANP